MLRKEFGNELFLTDNMIFASDLYVDKKSQKMLTKKHLIPIAGKGIFRLPLYAVYFPEKGNRPEYCKIEFLHFQYYDRHEPFVIGLASDEENALAIVKDIVEQTFQSGDDELDYRAFIERYSDPVDDLSKVRGLFVIDPKVIFDEDA